MKRISAILFMAFAIFVMCGNAAAKNYCFCVGLSKCNSPNLADISSAQYDAIDFKKALSKQGYKGSVIVNQYATRENILKRVKNVVKAAKNPDDKIVLFFATHGDPDGFLYTYGGGGVYYREIIDILAQSRTKHVYVFVMACFSGTTASKGLDSDPNWSDNAIKRGITFVVSCRPNETSKSINNSNKNITPTRHSVFGNALIKGFRGQSDRNGDRKITIMELFKYIYNEVTTRMDFDDPDMAQHPQLIGPSSEHDTIVAKW
ncbi:MAG: caspase family protein [Muribaculaceae bacterium]|nr:caspase family protein [Muribaculaceae bacterium]